jgi:cobalt-zinc-cadmium efflux system outer membrane protein
MKLAAALLVAAAAPDGLQAAAPIDAEAAPAVPPAAAIGLSDTVGLEEVLAWLRERSPRTAADRSDINLAAAEEEQAKILPNPSIGYDDASTVSGEDTIGEHQKTLSLEWPLLIEGQRAARRRAAESHLTATRADVASRYADVARDARLLFSALLADQERSRTLQGALDDIEEVEHVVRARADAGTKSPYDVERIGVEVAAVRNRLASQKADTEASAGDLALLLGAPGWRPNAAGVFAPIGLLPPADLPSAVDETAIPALVAAHAEEAAAAADHAAARRESWPVPEVRYGGFDTADPGGHVRTYGLSVPIPLFDRAQGQRSRTEAEMQAASLRRTLATAEARAAVDRAGVVLARRREALAAFERDATSRLQTVREMAEASYRAGQGGILEFLDALRSLTDTRMTHIDLIEEVMRAEVELLAATGRIDAVTAPASATGDR